MESLISHLLQFPPLLAYALLFLSAYVENVFPPIPGDTVTVVGAYMVGEGHLNFWGVYLTTTAGSILGFMTIFWLAYWLEWKFIEKYRPNWISSTRLDKVQQWFGKYGYWIVLANRFLAGSRSLVSVVAGLSKLDGKRVFLLALVSCAVWNGILIFAGSSIGKNWEGILDFIKVYNRFVIATLAVLALAVAVFMLIKKRNKSRSSFKM